MLAEVIVDSNLTLTFPLEYSIKESDSNKIITCTDKKIEFIVSRQLSKIKDRSKEEFDSSMQTYRRMIATQKITSDYKKKYTDTILGGTHGLFVSLQNDSMNYLVNKLYIFYTTKDHFAYHLFVKFKDTGDNISEQQAVSFFKQLRFVNDYYITLPDTTSRRKKYNTIELIIGWVTALSVLSYLTYSIFKKKVVI
jgi:hypothetical protein